MYAINDKARTVEVTEVDSVVVTTITADEEFGGYKRDIRVFAKTSADESIAAEVVLTLRLRAQTIDPLQIEVPASEF